MSKQSTQFRVNNSHPPSSNTAKLKRYDSNAFPQQPADDMMDHSDIYINDKISTDDNNPLFEEELLSSTDMSSNYTTNYNVPKLIISDPSSNLIVQPAPAFITSPRRSCDSAYGSSMETNTAPGSDTPLEGGSSSSDERGMGVTSTQLKSLWLEPVAKSSYKSSQSSCCSSPVSESNSDFGGNNDSVSATGKGNLAAAKERVTRQAILRRLSSASKYSLRSSLSIESEDDLISSDDGCFPNSKNIKNSSSPNKAPGRSSSWTKLRRMVIWSPFMQSFKKNYPWVQLAGHTGNFQPGQEGCILKKHVKGEAEFLKLMSEDVDLRGLAPSYNGVVTTAGHKYTRMQDLLLTFDAPSIMDCKMGVRTYLEDELAKAKNNPKLRPDMYSKMVEISPEAPTSDEHREKAVTKPRYMQWRELVSSTSNLGFRIEGIKKANKEPSKDYKLTKTTEQVTSAFEYFIDDNLTVLEKYIERLEEMKIKLSESQLFHEHEVIGSSLLFVHDQTCDAGTWMIDFGKTTKLPEGITNDHDTDWIEGNREDGYLFGMENLINIFRELRDKLKKAETEEQQDEIVTTTTSEKSTSCL